jgi:hypothetical protein
MPVRPAPIPDFFLVGAPKSGTTAMFEYLGRHPDVFVPRKKEPTYFARDLDEGTAAGRRYFVRDLDRYLELFEGWRGEQRIGEASVWYLYSEAAAAGIKEFSPEARIIVMLRSPVEMMHALHSQRLASGAEDIAGFAEALAAESDRAEGRRIPKNAFVTKGLLYRQVASYSRQVERYFETFGRERVHVLVFEEFTRDTPAAYRTVCEFLGIDASFRPQFDLVNPNTVVRSRLLRDLLRFGPSLFGDRRPGRLRKRWRRLRGLLLRLNERVEARPALEPELRRRLENELLPDVARLGELLDRDLVELWELRREGG